MVQRIIGTIILVVGLIYGVILARDCLRDREALKAEKGRFGLLCVLEFFVYLLCSIGVSDFLLNNLALTRFRLADGKGLPSTVIASCILPGVVLAFTYLNAEGSIDMLTLILFLIFNLTGCAIGSKMVSKLDGAVVKKALGYALIFSLVALIIKIIVSAGAVGTLTGLRGIKLVIMCVLGFVMGVINMLGVPMKPAVTAMFLILGMSPLSTLTMVLVMGGSGPLSGSVQIVKDKYYNKKYVLAALTAGSVAAILGSLFTISLDPTVLNIILLVVMVIAIISIFKPVKA
jgi:uncharacterized membrane protein YfcA